MESFVYNSIPDSEYSGLITLLDYEVSLEHLLSGLRVDDATKPRKILVDLAVAVGLGSFRFVEHALGPDGTVASMENGVFVKPEGSIESFADSVLRQHKSALSRSVLTGAARSRILDSGPYRP